MLVLMGLPRFCEVVESITAGLAECEPHSAKNAKTQCCDFMAGFVEFGCPGFDDVNSVLLKRQCNKTLLKAGAGRVIIS